MLLFSKSKFSSIAITNFKNLIIGFLLSTFFIAFINFFDLSIITCLSTGSYILGALYFVKISLYFNTTSHYVFEEHGSKILHNFSLGCLFLLISALLSI